MPAAPIYGGNNWYYAYGENCSAKAIERDAGVLADLAGGHANRPFQVIDDGWQLAGAVKLVGISSAQCVAAQAQTEGLAGRVAVVIDAQRGEFYLGSYEISAQGCSEVRPLRLATMADAQQCQNAGEQIIGPEVTNWFPAGRVAVPRAATLARLASGRSDSVSAEKLEPIYLRETNFVKTLPPRILPP